VYPWAFGLCRSAIGLRSAPYIYAIYYLCYCLYIHIYIMYANGYLECVVLLLACGAHPARSCGADQVKSNLCTPDIYPIHHIYSIFIYIFLPPPPLLTGHARARDGGRVTRLRVRVHPLTLTHPPRLQLSPPLTPTNLYTMLLLGVKP